MRKRILTFLFPSMLTLLCSLTLPSNTPYALADSIEVYPDDLQVVWGVSFSPDDQYVVATFQEGVVLIWERESCRLKSLFQPLPINNQRRIITGIAWSPTQQQFATAMYEGSVRLWQLQASTGWTLQKEMVYTRSVSKERSRRGSPEAERWGDSPGFRSVAFSPDGTLLAAAGHGPFIYVWKTNGEDAPIHILNGQAETIHTVTFGRDNSTVLSAGDDGVVRFWDLDHEKEIRTIQTVGPVINLAISPDKHYLAASSYGENQRTVIYDFDTGKEIRQFTIASPSRKMPSVIWSQAFSPNSRLLAVGAPHNDNDILIRLFDVEKGQEIWTAIFSNKERVEGLAYSHNGKFLVGGISGDAPYLLDAETGAILRRYGWAICDSKKERRE